MQYYHDQVYYFKGIYHNNAVFTEKSFHIQRLTKIAY